MSAPGITEPAEAITRAKAGDAEAWGQLYHDYAPAIFRFCRRALPTREDAEDATMEVFMKLRGKLNQYDSTRSFTAWLYKVAANHCWEPSSHTWAILDSPASSFQTNKLCCGASSAFLRHLRW